MFDFCLCILNNYKDTHKSIDEDIKYNASGIILSILNLYSNIGDIFNLNCFKFY